MGNIHYYKFKYKGDEPVCDALLKEAKMLQYEPLGKDSTLTVTPVQFAAVHRGKKVMLLGWHFDDCHQDYARQLDLETCPDDDRSRADLVICRSDRPDEAVFKPDIIHLDISAALVKLGDKTKLACLDQWRKFEKVCLGRTGESWILLPSMSLFTLRSKEDKIKWAKILHLHWDEFTPGYWTEADRLKEKQEYGADVRKKCVFCKTDPPSIGDYTKTHGNCSVCGIYACGIHLCEVSRRIGSGYRCPKCEVENDQKLEKKQIIKSSTRVVNKKTSTFDVYIGRGDAGKCPWGNPFVMANQTTAERKRVIAEYDKWLDTQPNLLARLPELVGKTLGCFCAPKECHGDVLVRRCNQLVTVATAAETKAKSNASNKRKPAMDSKSDMSEQVEKKSRVSSDVGKDSVTCTLGVDVIRSHLYRYMDDSINSPSNVADIYSIYEVARHKSKSGQGILLTEFRDLNEALGSQIIPKFVELEYLPEAVLAEIKQSKTGKYHSDILFENETANATDDDRMMYSLPVVAYLQTEQISSRPLFGRRLKRPIVKTFAL